MHKALVLVLVVIGSILVTPAGKQQRAQARQLQQQQLQRLPVQGPQLTIPGSDTHLTVADDSGTQSSGKRANNARLFTDAPPSKVAQISLPAGRRPTRVMAATDGPHQDFIRADAMGVQYCQLRLCGAAFTSALGGTSYHHTILLHVYLKHAWAHSNSDSNINSYSNSNSKGSSDSSSSSSHNTTSLPLHPDAHFPQQGGATRVLSVKGFMSAQLLHAPPTALQQALWGATLDPQLILQAADEKQQGGVQGSVKGGAARAAPSSCAAGAAHGIDAGCELRGSFAFPWAIRHPGLPPTQGNQRALNIHALHAHCSMAGHLPSHSPFIFTLTSPNAINSCTLDLTPRPPLDWGANPHKPAVDPGKKQQSPHRSLRAVLPSSSRQSMQRDRGHDPPQLTPLTGGGSRADRATGVDSSVIGSYGINNKMAFQPNQVPSQAAIVMWPFFQVTDAKLPLFAMLVDRHIRWHRALGFSRLLLYMRPALLPSFLDLPHVRAWTRQGALLLVEWDFEVGDANPFYDQHVVYTHANLALTGHNVYLAVLDLDEYVMSLRRDLLSIQDMLRECAGKDSLLPIKKPHRRRGQTDPAAGGRQLLQGQEQPDTALSIEVEQQEDEQEEDAGAEHGAEEDLDGDNVKAGDVKQPGDRAKVGKAATASSAASSDSQDGEMEDGAADTSTWVPFNVAVQRWDVVMAGHSNRTQPEIELWMNDWTAGAGPEGHVGADGGDGWRHPVLRYSMAHRNAQGRRNPKSIVRPEAIHSLSVHYGAHYSHLPAVRSWPKSQCLLILHARSLWGLRDKDKRSHRSDEALRRRGYVERNKLREELEWRGQAVEPPSPDT